MIIQEVDYVVRLCDCMAPCRITEDFGYPDEDWSCQECGATDVRRGRICASLLPELRSLEDRYQGNLPGLLSHLENLELRTLEMIREEKLRQQGDPVQEDPRPYVERALFALRGCTLKGLDRREVRDIILNLSV